MLNCFLRLLEKAEQLNLFCIKILLDISKNISTYLVSHAEAEKCYFLVVNVS